jgi:hypothetical protein
MATGRDQSWRSVGHFGNAKDRVSEANLVKGWGPDGFAGGAGKRRRFPGYWQQTVTGF